MSGSHEVVRKGYEELFNELLRCELLVIDATKHLVRTVAVSVQNGPEHAPTLDELDVELRESSKMVNSARVELNMAINAVRKALLERADLGAEDPFA